MRRRIALIMAIVLCTSMILAACGKKDAASVVKDLDKTVSKMESYHGVGSMTINTGAEPQVYNVEVCYQAPDFYRIALTNDTKDVTQIILRNDDGVFVLTPHLKKSFRFQSDWPENQGQVYLYQTLAQSIVMDDSRQFTELDEAYVFDVEANYKSGSLARQKIWLNKKDYSPSKVEVSDENANVLVSVDFEQFNFGHKFEKDYFDMERNMTSYEMKSLPTMAQGKLQETPAHEHGSKATTDAASKQEKANSNEAPKQEKAANEEANQETTQSKTEEQGKATTEQSQQSEPNGKTDAPEAVDDSGASETDGAAEEKAEPTAAAPTETAAADKQNEGFGVIEPSYTPAGVKQQSMSDMKLGDLNAVLLRYSGEYNYTLMESRPTEKTVTAETGSLVDVVELGFTNGILLGDKQKTLHWTNEGVEFRLSSSDLTKEEMIKIARSTAGELGK
ncbi:outer membrane lipoprotein-sorting protein [Paenibacillus turpanensis]|uniref:outer membrane lipoprotein-sorting protein n=1 Tax=Paenibacillus turpanensis TaxID=2689078 RepID=UPI001409418C|nr:outer membrane lipoprotein-sorting protein [Paenibacillus turpanensis]